MLITLIVAVSFYHGSLTTTDHNKYWLVSLFFFFRLSFFCIFCGVSFFPCPPPAKKERKKKTNRGKKREKSSTHTPTRPIPSSAEHPYIFCFDKTIHIFFLFFFCFCFSFVSRFCQESQGFLTKEKERNKETKKQRKKNKTEKSSLNIIEHKCNNNCDIVNKTTKIILALKKKVSKQTNKQTKQDQRSHPRRNLVVATAGLVCH